MTLPDPESAAATATPSVTARWLTVPVPVHAGAAPRGDRLVLTAVQVPLGAEDPETSLIVIDLVTGEASPVLAALPGDHTATWSPDSSTLAFTTEREGVAQIAVAAIDDAATRCVTSLPAGVSGPASWSPDGRRFVVTGARGRGVDRTRPWRSSRAVLWADGVGALDDPPQLWVCDVETGGCTMLTDDEWHWSLPRWSPDGETIAAAAALDPTGSRRGQHLRLVSLDGTWTEPAVPGGFGVVPAWASDGSLLVLSFQPEGRPVGAEAQLHRILPDRQVERLDTSSPVAVGGTVYGDSPAAIGEAFDAALLVHGTDVYVRTQRGGRMGVAHCSLDTREWRIVVDGDRCTTPLAAGSHGLAIAEQSAAAPCRITLARLDADPASSRREIPLPVTHPVEAPVAADVHRFTVPSPHDGALLDGWHLRPPGVDGPLPTVLIVHGGPNAAFGECFHHDAQALCDAGFGVLYTNPHGSTGSGDDFTHAVIDHWGDIPTADVLAVVDHAVEQGWVDPDRLGVTGNSYGGYLTAWLACTTDRFRAGVSENPAIDLLSMYGTSDIGVHFLPMHMTTTPFEDLRPYLEWSPLLRADGCRTPLLFVIGTDDRRCPPTQALAMHQVLRSSGRTSEVLVLPGCSHESTTFGPVVARLAHDEALVEWMDRWLRTD